MKSLYEQNAELLLQLEPSKQWAALCWLNDCAKLNYQFRITEVYRTQERQNQLYAQGRTKPGPIVTWTKDSNHTKRLAADVYPINCTHGDITDVARKYGITHPLKIDPPHYEFTTAKEKPVLRIPSTLEEAIRKLEREIHKTKPGRLLDRKKARLYELRRQQGNG